MLQRAIGLLVCLCAVASPVHAGVLDFLSVWNRAGLPKPIRGMIHTTASKVPPFQHDDSVLQNPNDWPESMEFAGKRFIRSIIASSAAGTSAHQSMATVPAGQGVHISYVYVSGNAGIVIGPSYSWNEHGRLWRRAWYEPDTVMVRSTRHATYPSGRVLEYTVARRRQDMGRPDRAFVFTEYFDPKGNLVGVGHETSGRNQYWWEGKAVPESDWDNLRRALFQSMAAEEAGQAKAAG